MTAEPICSLELEFFVLGRTCPEVLRFLRDRNPIVTYSGKGSGFWLELPGCGVPAWFKISGDGPYCFEDLVFEAALPETNAPTAAYLVQHSLLPWLARLEREMGENGAPVRFMTGPDLHGHRSAFQVNLVLDRVEDIRAYYAALAPLVLTLSCVTGPGGPVPGEGYVLAPRLNTHCRPGHYLGSDASLRHAPVAYPRWRDYGAGHRAHFSLEYSRLPGAMLLVAGVLSLATRAYEIAPKQFDLRFLDEPIAAARGLNRLGEPRVLVEAGMEEHRWSGLELQEAFLERIIEPVLSGVAAAPEWTEPFLEYWRAAIAAQREGRPCPASDFSTKHPYLETLVSRAGLQFGSRECQAAYALCASLLHAQVDLDTFFSRPACTLPLDDRRASLRRHLETVPPERLREIYLGGLREALLFEVAWQRIGPGSAADQLTPDPAEALLLGSRPYLAPRAAARAELFQAHREDLWMAADWDRIETLDSFLYCRDPRDAHFSDDPAAGPVY